MGGLEDRSNIWTLQCLRWNKERQRSEQYLIKQLVLGGWTQLLKVSRRMSFLGLSYEAFVKGSAECIHNNAKADSVSHLLLQSVPTGSTHVMQFRIL